MQLDAAFPTNALPIRYLVVATLARLADEGARVAFLLLALDRTDSAAFGGLLVAALLVPHVLAAPIVGALADRAHKRRRFHAVALLIFGAVLILCAALIGRAPAPLVLLIALVGGVVGPLLTGGLTGLLRDLVAPPMRDRAYSLDVVSYNAAGIVGPAVAAVIAGWVNAEVAVFVLAGGSVAGAALMMTLPIPDNDDSSSASHAPLRAAFAQGMGVFIQDRLLRSVTIGSCIAQLGSGAMPLAIALLATDRGTPSTVGLFLTATAIGGLIGSLAYARYPIGTESPEWVMITCFATIALPFSVLALTFDRPILTAILCAVIGFINGPQGAALFLIRDRQAPPAIHTQVFTTGAGLKMTSSAAGSAIAGLVAGVGVRGLLLLIAFVYVVAALTSGVLLKRGR